MDWCNIDEIAIDYLNNLDRRSNTFQRMYTNFIFWLHLKHVGRCTRCQIAAIAFRNEMVEGRKKQDKE